MALSLTTDDFTGKNFTVNARAADNFKIITGSWSIPTTYATGGVTANLATLGFASGQILFAHFACSEQPCTYDYSNDKVKMYSITITATTCYNECASDTELTTTGGYFVAFGFGPA